MNYTFMFETVVVAVLGIIGGMILFMLKKEHGKTEKRALNRQKENMLMMDWMRASTKMGLATAIAVQKGEVNGQMEEARVAVVAAERDYQKFKDEMGARKVTK